MNASRVLRSGHRYSFSLLADFLCIFARNYNAIHALYNDKIEFSRKHRRFLPHFHVAASSDQLFLSYNDDTTTTSRYIQPSFHCPHHHPFSRPYSVRLFIEFRFNSETNISSQGGIIRGAFCVFDQELFTFLSIH
jgi:hypothetical protein